MAISKDKLVTVKNLCNWDVHFKLLNTIGDVVIKANGTKEMFTSEISSQVNNGNPFFVGTDGRGSHAKVYIKDDELRKEVNFFDEEDAEKKQLILDDEKCKEILNFKNTDEFEKNIEKHVVLNHEKDKIIQMARKLKLNDYGKITFLEEHTDINFKE